MELFVKIPKAVERVLRTYKTLINELEKAYNEAEEKLDTEEMLKLAYEIEALNKGYEKIRADADPYYKRSLEYKSKLKQAILEDDMATVIYIAKYMGHKQTDICRELNINDGNLSAAARGIKNRLSKVNRDRVYQYVWRLIM